MKRVAASTLILVGAALTVGGAALVFSESRLSRLAAGAVAIVVGLALLAIGIAARPRRRDGRRTRDWRFSPRG